MSGDRSLHLRNRQPWRLAVLARLAAAQEVRVHDAAPVLDRVEVETRAAVRAPQEPLERMIVNALASASAALVDEHILDSIEQLLADQRLMPAVVLPSLEHDSPQVPPVAEQSADGLDGHRPTVRHVLPRASPQTRLSDRPLEIFEAVAPGRIELEHRDDERRPLGVNRDGPHFPAIDPFPYVQVPQRRNTWDTAPRRLGCHLVSDVSARCSGLVLVDAVEDRGHQVADVAVLGVIHDRDQLHAELAKLPPSDRRIGRIAVHPRARVDHDRVHIFAVADPRHHLLELRPPINRHRRTA
nr:hypothetical protein [Glycomyces sp. NRRL B-16210]